MKEFFYRLRYTFRSPDVARQHNWFTHRKEEFSVTAKNKHEADLKASDIRHEFIRSANRELDPSGESIEEKSFCRIVVQEKTVYVDVNKIPESAIRRHQAEKELAKKALQEWEQRKKVRGIPRGFLAFIKKRRQRLKRRHG